MDWKVALIGNETSLQELAKVWNKPELTIEKEVDSYILNSSHFTSLTSDQDVREKADMLLVPLNAGIKLELGIVRPIEITHTIQIRPNGAKLAYKMCYEVVVASAFSEPEVIIKNEKGEIREIRNPADSTLSLSELAQSDVNVTKVCQYINQDLNSWLTLYKIYEVIEAECFPPLQRNGEYWKKAALFRRTANNPSSSGLNSRHAIDDSPPETPMSLSDAQNFIKLLIKEWLETKKNKV
jgi:hypothetical protein